MNWLKRGGFEISASLLFLCLLGSVLTISTYATLSQPQKIKTWFSQSGLYDQIVTNSINNAQNATPTAADTTALALTDLEVQRIARAVFTPQIVQQNVETFIDSNYEWLEGATTTPNFKIDLSQTKQDFARKTGENVNAYLTKLPVCNDAQLAQLQASGAVSPLRLACRPAALSPTVEAARVVQQIANGPFIDDPIITAETISSNYGTPGSQPYYEAANQAPDAYRLLEKAPYVLVALAVIFAALMFALADRRTAIRRIGFISFLVGLLLLCLKFASDFIVNKIESRVFTNENASLLQQPITSIVGNVEASLARIFLYAGIVFILIAVIILIGLLVKKDPVTEHQESIQELPYEQPSHESPVVDNTSEVTPVAAVKRPRPAMDIMMPKTKKAVPPQEVVQSLNPQKNKPRPRKRLIQ